MTFPRIVLSAAAVLALLVVCLAPRSSAPAATIPARELLTLTQRKTGASYTFDRSTSEALATARVPRPPEEADQAALEAALREAGFRLRPLETDSKRVIQVERVRG